MEFTEVKVGNKYRVKLKAEGGAIELPVLIISIRVRKVPSWNTGMDVMTFIAQPRPVFVIAQFDNGATGKFRLEEIMPTNLTHAEEAEEVHRR